jgi:hypothetical protein
MKFKVMTVLGAIALITGAATASASSARSGELHIVKECSQNKGNAGDFCTITSSNVTEIQAGSKIFYDQAFGIPEGLLDSNIVLDASGGSRAVGRCTLDPATWTGLCTLSDGTGDLTGLSARVNVVCTLGGSPCHWDGTYRFRSVR